MLKRINSTEPENNVAAENSSLTPPSSQPDLSGTITDETVAQSSNVKRVKSYATPLDTAPYFLLFGPNEKIYLKFSFKH